MQKTTLAQALRSRQYALSQVPAALLEALSDEEIIWSYITCSCCGEPLVSGTDLALAIWQATDADDFLTRCGQLDRGHR